MSFLGLIILYDYLLPIWHQYYTYIYIYIHIYICIYIYITHETVCWNRRADEKAWHLNSGQQSDARSPGQMSVSEWLLPQCIYAWVDHMDNSHILFTKLIPSRCALTDFLQNDRKFTVVFPCKRNHGTRTLELLTSIIFLQLELSKLHVAIHTL